MTSAKRFAHMFFVSFWIWVAATLTCSVGCKDNAMPVDDMKAHLPGNIIIQMDTDTLIYRPGDTVTAQGVVLVTDESGLVMPNIKVTLTESEQFGAIVFVDSIRRDTTNAYGRVGFDYLPNVAYPNSGTDTITATVDNLSASWYMRYQPSREIGYQYHISVGSDTVSIRPPDRRDSTMVTVTITDSLGNPSHNGFDYPSMGVDVFASCGGLGYFSQLDTSGVITAWWYFRPGLIQDICCVTVRQDSACVVLLH